MQTAHEITAETETENDDVNNSSSSYDGKVIPQFPPKRSSYLLFSGGTFANSVQNSRDSPVTVELPFTENYPRKIVMPFSLLNKDKSQRSPSLDEGIQIMKLFPGCVHVKHLPPYLILVVKPMPNTRLPNAIADIPCYITESETDLGPVGGINCHGPPCQGGMKFELWRLPRHEVRRSILQELLPLGVRSLGWVGTRWLMVADMPEERAVRVLPRKIGNMIASFLPHKRHHDRSLRLLSPSTDTYDNSDYYPALHAGMMVTDTNVFTTTGVPLVHPSSPTARFFTVPEHGFLNLPRVIHPSPIVGHVVGQIWKIFPHTDIALAKITDPNVTVSAETFAGAQGTTKLTRLADQTETHIGQELFMDSPFTGLGEGYMYVSDIAAIPTDEPAVQPRAYIASLWVNFGNQLPDPVDGCCGSPLWDCDGKVHAFFRYYRDESGISYCPAPDPLINEGYELRDC